MKAALKLPVVASVFALTAGSAAWAQNYATNPGTQGSNQGSWNNGMQGTSTPYRDQNLSQSG